MVADGLFFLCPTRNLCAARLLVCSGGTENRQPFMKAARCNARAAFLFKSPRVLARSARSKVWDDPGLWKAYEASKAAIQSTHHRRTYGAP
jgi:hypothetical protein